MVDVVAEVMKQTGLSRTDTSICVDVARHCSEQIKEKVLEAGSLIPANFVTRAVFFKLMAASIQELGKRLDEFVMEHVEGLVEGEANE